MNKNKKDRTNYTFKTLPINLIKKVYKCFEFALTFQLTEHLHISPVFKIISFSS